MERVTNIIKNNEYEDCLKKIKALEKHRKYCKHNKKHFLDVARIAYILKLERNLDINKEIIYATALLHDIGRHIQYEKGIPHEKASAKIANSILKDSGFKGEEIKQIVSAIEEHRHKSSESSDLGTIIYEGDKLSRKCFSCSQQNTCNWKDDKKNYIIKY
jgi:putative nucleotidyltransferase with HDIG domain